MTDTQQPRLMNYPITFLAIPLGLAGFTLAFQKGSELLNLPMRVSTGLLWMAVGAFAIALGGYLAKAIRYPKEVKADFNHPIKINFFPLIAKILLVFSVVFLSRDMLISKYLWFAGAALQLISSLVIISMWVHHEHFTIDHLTPAWFIPIVGSLIVPIAGVEHGFVEISWFFFSVGILFWLALFTVVLNRMIFHHPIMKKLVPTLFILFAPPAIAFIAYYKLTGNLDGFARIMYYVAVFLFVLVLMKARLFFKLDFYLSWWAYSFPLAAKALSSILMYHISKSVFVKTMAQFELILLLAIVIVLVVQTVIQITNRRICVPEE